MSEEIREVYIEGTESDEEFEERVRARKARARRRKLARKFFGMVLIIAAFAIVGTMCGKEIIKLKAENYSLRQEQKELEKERDKLREEVKNSQSKEFLQEQVKKQLGLLNPGELLFTFEDEE